MRLGGPVFGVQGDPELWVAAHQRCGFRAAYCPVEIGHSEEVIRRFTRAAASADLIIAEVGAWSNPISPDEAVREAALELCRERLALAEAIGARCCVNIAGSRSLQWDGPHPDNLSPQTFDLIVETVRKVIDAVKPSRTYYTLETMPWIYPDSPDAYLALMKAIDRRQFAVHLDPANLMCSPQRYFENSALIRECFSKLGPYIRSCHAKDVRLSGQMTVHLDEVRPGLGGLDYRAFLRELDRLDPQVPLMLEHLSSAEDYALAASHIRSVAGEIGVAL